MSTDTKIEVHDIETGTSQENGTCTLFDNSVKEYFKRVPVQNVGVLTDAVLLTNRSLCPICSSKKYGGTCDNGHSGAYCSACGKYTVHEKCPDGCDAPEEVD